MARFTTDADYKALIGRLIELRKQAGVTQVQLAERLGDKPQSYVSKIERCERRMDILEFCDFARALGQLPSVVLADIEGRLS